MWPSETIWRHWCPAITCTNDGLLSIGLLRPNPNQFKRLRWRVENGYIFGPGPQCCIKEKYVRKVQSLFTVCSIIVSPYGIVWRAWSVTKLNFIINTVHVLYVTSRLDYCNSLLYGINGYLVSQLQRCQNNAARIVSLRRKYDHITPVLEDLHWLPVEYRINYKILLLAYKAQHGMAPPYLSSLLSPYKPGRSLRSEGKHLLTTPRYRLEGFGKRCFAHAAPSLWNALPITIKCAQSIDIFKSNLKTHLFNIAYS